MEADTNNNLRRALEDRQPFHKGQELPGELEADANKQQPERSIRGQASIHAGQELPGELKADVTIT